MVTYEFDGRFSISISSTDSQPITKENWQRVSNILQEALNEEKVIRKINQHFELSTIGETHCKVSDLKVEQKPKQ